MKYLIPLLLLCSGALNAQLTEIERIVAGDDPIEYSCGDCDYQRYPQVVDIIEVVVEKELWVITIEKVSSWGYEAFGQKIKNYDRWAKKKAKLEKKRNVQYYYVRKIIPTQWREGAYDLNIFKYKDVQGITDGAVAQFLKERQYYIDRGYWKRFETKNLR